MSSETNIENDADFLGCRDQCADGWQIAAAVLAAVILLGGWVLGAMYHERHLERVVLAKFCDSVDRWNIEAAQGIAEVNRRGTRPVQGVVCP